MDYKTLSTLSSRPEYAALHYAAAGWPVFPTSAEKTPLTAHGFKDGTTDPEIIRGWWSRWPAAGVGLPTGGAIGCFVLDIDPRHGGDDSLAALEAEHGALPATLEVETGGGGRHLYFQHVEDVKNSAGKLGAGIDIRGDGGYVVAPPSGHQSGGVYRWRSIMPPAAAPEWLVALLLPRPRPATTPPTDALALHHQQLARWRGSGGGDTAYGLAALEEEAAEIRGTPEGGRNDRLNRGAFAAGQLVAGGELTETTARARLEEAGQAAGLSPAEVRATVESGLTGGQRTPRSAPERPRPRSHSASGAGGGGDTEAPPAHHEAGDGDSAEKAYPLPPSLGETLTDSGNADLLVERFGADIRYMAEADDWLVWNGRQWEPNARHRMESFAQLIGRDFYRRAAIASDKGYEKRAEQYAKHAKNSLSKGGIKNAVELARIYPAIRVKAEQFDQMKDRVNVANGIINLRTGELLPHKREEYHRHIIDIDYNPDATCPTWRAALNQIFLGRAELVNYIQAYAGYSLTGETGDQSFLILYGKGSNGKSLLLRALADILGPYAKATRSETLTEKKNIDAGANPDIAALWGARFVSAAETKAGTKLDESLVKQATGQDSLTARFLFKDFFEFRPMFKLWYSVNHRPRIDGTDEAMVRRIRLCPFDATFKREPTAPNDFPLDDALAERLHTERAGILRWLVEGSIRYYHAGLTPPDIVRAATASYASDMDTFSAFMAERCLVAADHRTRAGDLLEAYRDFCAEAGETPRHRGAWKALLERAGLVTERGHGGARWIRGVGLLAKESAD